VLHRKRVINGWPDSWRPEKIFGKGGSNDLINQRLVGEVNLEDFEVSHTKDEINWCGDEEDQVEAGLFDACKDYRAAAQKARKADTMDHGPSQVQVDAAIKTLEEELSTPMLLDKLALEDAIPPRDQVTAANSSVVRKASQSEPTIKAKVADVTISVFIDTNLSHYDPYLVVEAKSPNELLIVVSRAHPHWSMLEGENAIVNYLKHCVYDGIAEHRASVISRVDSETIKLLKDKYLRVAFERLQEDQ
jgi:hypothetical protein